MKRIAIFITILLLMILALPAGAAAATAAATAAAAPLLDRIVEDGETVDEDIVIFGGRLVVEKGGTVSGEVSVFGGEAVLAGQVEGDVSIFGGETTLSGEIDGDLVVFGGNMDVTSSAEVDGDCILVGGNLAGDGASGINCTTVGEMPGLAVPAFVRPPVRSDIPAPPELPRLPRISPGGSSFGEVGRVAGRSLLMGILALLAASLAPAQLGQVQQTLTRKPAASGAVGLLTAIAVPSLAAILLLISAVLTIVCIGLLGYPIVLVLVIGLLVGALMGWIAAGTWLGGRLAGWLKLTNRGLPVTAALGTTVLTLAVGLLSSLPFLLGGWLWAIAAVAIACGGLGAVALTRFGTRSYPLAAAGGDSKVDVVLETLPVEEESGEEIKGQSE
jgi:hypothetical protein